MWCRVLTATICVYLLTCIANPLQSHAELYNCPIAGYESYTLRWMFPNGGEEDFCITAYACASGDTIGCGGVAGGMIEQRANINCSGGPPVTDFPPSLLEFHHALPV